MKIIIQVATATLGDIAIEETNEKNTTNPDDQRAILVELLYEAIYKIQASYRIPTEMLDMGEYTSADVRHQELLKQPRESSAERNRLAQDIEKQECCGQGGCCDSSVNEDSEQNIEGDVELYIEDHEVPAIQMFLAALRSGQTAQEVPER